MPEWLSALVFVLAVGTGLFLLSNVLPRHRSAKKRRERVDRFLDAYHAYVGGDATQADWLAAHASEMQVDAQSVNLGVVFVAPPPMIGGQYRPHQIFADIFGQQSYTDNVDEQYRLQVLLDVQHQLETRERRRRNDLFNPWAWIRLSFERIVRFPRYVLLQAGFSNRVADSSPARAITALWSLVVGLAGIGSFVVALVVLLRGGEG